MNDVENQLVKAGQRIGSECIVDQRIANRFFLFLKLLQRDRRSVNRCERSSLKTCASLMELALSNVGITVLTRESAFAARLYATGVYENSM